MADDSLLAQMLGITSSDQSTQPTAQATGTPMDPITGQPWQGDFPGKQPWDIGIRGVARANAPGPIRSTADLADWRNQYASPPKLFYDIPWAQQRGRSYQAQSVINRMPWVFDPAATQWPVSTGDLRNSIFPGFGLGENTLLGAQGSNLSGLLGSLTSDQRSMLAKLLGVDGTQTNPSSAAAPVTAADATSPTATTTPSRTGPAAASTSPQLAPWQSALSSNNDAFFGLPENTLSTWKMTGLGRNVGVDPSTYWFFQGLPPDAQNAFMQHQSQYRPDTSPGALQSILSAWQQPPSNISNPLGVPYPWPQ